VAIHDERPAPELPADDTEPTELAERPGDELAAADEGESPLLDGVRTAGIITLGTFALEAVAMGGNWLTAGSQQLLFVLLEMTISGAGFLVLTLAASRLPRRAQPPFWAVGILFVSMAFALLGRVCGIL
jgi:hypothetical protein